MEGFLDARIPEGNPAFLPVHAHERRWSYTPNTQVVSQHPKMTPVRGVAHTSAIDGMLAGGYIPCIVTKDANGNKIKPFSNVNLCKYKYFVGYMDAEGLTMAHAESRCVRPTERFCIVPCNDLPTSHVTISPSHVMIW